LSRQAGSDDKTPYPPTHRQGFRLWTPGWDGRDDGGQGGDVVWGKTGVDAP